MAKPLSPLTPEVIAETAAATVRVAPVLGRMSLRARGDLAPLEAALGVSLPTRISARAEAGGIAAACLGPDEWVLIMPADRVAAVEMALAGVYGTLAHSTVDISGRELRLEIDGPRAAELLSIACPRDIATIAIGDARRTVFDGVSVLLWRDTETAFRMDVWNSFAPFVAQTLETGCKELAAETAA